MHESREIGFDTDRYLYYQTKKIKEILQKSADVLYLEFGGKLIQDKHCARVLPGYREDVKFELLKNLHKESEIVFVVSARDILRGRIRGDFGTSYDQESLRTIHELMEKGLRVNYFVISLLEKDKPIPRLLQTLARNIRHEGIQTHFFFNLASYHSKYFDSSELALNPFIEREKKLVIVASPGGGSGKFGICLNQLFYEMKRQRVPRYSKFETFPVHDLPTDHPLNLAYMAASADFYDVVMKDTRHGGNATSYNRDLENYELLRILAAQFVKEGKHLRQISSATSMGVNMISKGITDDEVIQKEAAAEIARRYVRYKFEVANNKEDKKVLARVKKILTML